MKKIREYIMDTKLFWRLYFWWGIRQARKRREAWEAEVAKRPAMDNDDYWDMVHRRKQND
jgi:hypothetical protein